MGLEPDDVDAAVSRSRPVGPGGSGHGLASNVRVSAEPPRLPASMTHPRCVRTLLPAAPTGVPSG